MELSPAEHQAARRRAVDGLCAAWPEGEAYVDELRSSFVLAVGDDESGPFVRLRCWGTETTFWEVRSIDDLNAVIDSWVETKAWDLERDRWVAGDGWREYDGTADT